MCEKGKKCKNSHDFTTGEAKQAKIDIYTDPREKLGKMPDTIITCKNFLEAVESEMYGYKWVCKDGGDACIYRHMLPLGYVLNRDKGDNSDDEDEVTLEEKIEEERNALDTKNQVMVTKESFEQWKRDKAAKKQAELEARIAEAAKKTKKDKNQMGFLSGKALFSFDPTLFADDADAVDDELYNDYGMEDDEEVK